MKVSWTFLVNFLFILILFSVFGLQCWKCISAYLAGDTSVRMEVLVPASTRFPSLGLAVGWDPAALGQSPVFLLCWRLLCTHCRATGLDRDCAAGRARLG